jgi:CBS domain containing-hemolysin-like protein
MIILIFLSGWFSGTETALTNINESEIAEMKRNNEKNVDFIMKAKRDMDRTLVAILIGNNVVNILLSSVAAVIANELFHTIGVTIMVFVITFLIIIFGEITPKSNAIWDTKKVAQNNSKTIYYLTRALSPLITLFMIICRGLISLTGKKITKKGMLVSDESIKSLATLGEEEGLIKKVERDIIHNVFLFGDKKIKEIMVPKDKIFFLQEDLSVQDASDLVAQGGFTRIPVMGVENKVVGVLNSKDLIDKNEGLIKPLLKSPFIVKEDDDITDTFKSMREKRVHLAVVRDKSEKCIGIVTLEDIIEELVGEIYDEYFDVKYGKTQPKSVINKSQLPS